MKALNTWLLCLSFFYINGKDLPHYYMEQKERALCMKRVLSTKTFIIGCEGFGFFSSFLGVLSNLAWCEKKNLTPIIYWGNHSLYYQKFGYNGSYNAWEYYFEPLNNYKYNQDDIAWNSYAAPDGSFIGILGDKGKSALNEETRHSVQRLINKYIKIKPCIKNKIESFYQNNMLGKKTIGIHIRGTDKDREIKRVKNSIIFETANKAAQEFQECQFLVATDEQATMEQAKREITGPVIYYDAYRSSDATPIHTPKTFMYSKAKLGEEVLIETLLLARCDRFVHTCSNVSMAVLFFNPEIKNIMLQC